MRPEGLGKLIKFNYLIGSRTRGLPACSIVPETLLLLLLLLLLSSSFNSLDFCFSSLCLSYACFVFVLTVNRQWPVNSACK
jgi:hypothetical protein